MRPLRAPGRSIPAERLSSRSASILVRHVRAQYEDDLNQLRLPPATTIGAFVAWPLTERLQLIARADNLLNATVVAGADTDGSIEKATPRTLWIGFRLTDF